jgi:hypothetical protein
MRVGYQKRTIAGDKTICLPVPDGVDYDIWIKDPVGFRQYSDLLIDSAWSFFFLFQCHWTIPQSMVLRFRLLCTSSSITISRL